MIGLFIRHALREAGKTWRSWVFEDGLEEDAKWTEAEREQVNVVLRSHPRWKEYDTIMFTWVLYKNSSAERGLQFEAKKSTWESGYLTAGSARELAEKVLNAH